MKRIMISCVALAALAAPAFAGQPDGILWPFKDNTDYSSIENKIGHDSAQIIQNGQFVSGNCNCGIDQTTTPGSRADAVQAVHADQGRAETSHFRPPAYNSKTAISSEVAVL